MNFHAHELWRIGQGGLRVNDQRPKRINISSHGWVGAVVSAEMEVIVAGISGLGREIYSLSIPPGGQRPVEINRILNVDVLINKNLVILDCSFLIPLGQTRVSLKHKCFPDREIIARSLESRINGLDPILIGRLSQRRGENGG